MPVHWKLTYGAGECGALAPPYQRLEGIRLLYCFPAAAGVFAQTLVFPIDTVRNRLMMNAFGGYVVRRIVAAFVFVRGTTLRELVGWLIRSRAARYAGTWDCFRSIYRTEGIRAFYNGA